MAKKEEVKKKVATKKKAVKKVAKKVVKKVLDSTELDEKIIAEYTENKPVYDQLLWCIYNSSRRRMYIWC